MPRRSAACLPATRWRQTRPGRPLRSCLSPRARGIPRSCISAQASKPQLPLAPGEGDHVVASRRGRRGSRSCVSPRASKPVLLPLVLGEGTTRLHLAVGQETCASVFRRGRRETALLHLTAGEGQVVQLHLVGPFTSRPGRGFRRTRRPSTPPQERRKPSAPGGAQKTTPCFEQEGK